MSTDHPSSAGHRQLSDTATSLYAETLEHLLAAEAAGLDRNLRGSFKRRTLSGRHYWYYQYRDLDQRVRQIYCGPVGGSWDAVASAPTRDPAAGGMDRAEQAGLLRAAGFPVVPASAFRLLAALTDAGLFKAGAVLVGTYGFMALGNQLGVAWTGRAATTQDVDVAHDRSVELAVEEASLSIPDVLQGLELGYHPVPKLDPRQPSTSFMFRNEQLRLDLLTPTHGRRTEPIHIPALGAPAQILRFLDYLIEAPQPAVLIGSRVLRVTVPDPARFAVHKLLISGERPSTETAKARKDIDQATRLFRILLSERPSDVANAWYDAIQRGKGWARRLNQALTKLPPDISDRLSNLDTRA